MKNFEIWLFIIRSNDIFSFSKSVNYKIKIDIKENENVEYINSFY